MNLVSPNGISSVDWMQGSLIAQKQQPLTWHKVWIYCSLFVQSIVFGFVIRYVAENAHIRLKAIFLNNAGLFQCS